MPLALPKAIFRELSRNKHRSAASASRKKLQPSPHFSHPTIQAGSPARTLSSPAVTAERRDSEIKADFRINRKSAERYWILNLENLELLWSLELGIWSL